MFLADMQCIRKMSKKNIIVLFGSTGDLAFRKLLPAICQLYEIKEIDKNTLVIAIGRRNFDREKYFQFLSVNNEEIDISILKEILIYHKMEITVEKDYEGLKDLLKKNADEKTRIIHYLAISPELVDNVTKLMGKTNLIHKGNKKHSILFEKPFGQNLETSKAMNKELLKIVNDAQIYRVDHYLTKKKIEQIVKLKLEEDSLDEFLKLDNIQEIKISITEKRGILNRGAFYDKTGAIKDMLQSHILQLLSILLIDKSKSYKNVAEAKLEALKKLEFVEKSLILGQYRNYLKEKGVAENSNTETLVFCSFNYTKNDGNKILATILTAKNCYDDRAYFLIRLKGGEHYLRIYFNNYHGIVRRGKTLSRITINEGFNKSTLKDYAQLIKNAIKYNKTTFLTQKEIEQSWKICDLILENKNENILYNSAEDIDDILNDGDFFSR